jgi:hypothetical protein
MLNRPPLVAFSARYECLSNPAAETSRPRSRWAIFRLLRRDSGSRRPDWTDTDGR